MVANEGDGWTLTLEELERYYENCARVPLPEKLDGGDSQNERDFVGMSLDSAARLGKRTAALHLALAAPSGDPAFSPEPLTSVDLQQLLADLRQQAAQAFDTLRDNVARLPDEILDLAGLVLGRRRQTIENFGHFGRDEPQGQRIRIHGDYHLGQVIRVRSDYVILDFEGEPARPLGERRARQSPLKDVAGMLRSLSYAAYAGLFNYTARRPDDFDKLEPWARIWERSTSGEFLRAHRETASGAAFLPSGEEAFRGLLAAYWLDRAFYELSYELNNRPAWVRIPLLGILSLPIEAGGHGWSPAPSRSPR
jgi:maltose alpha-D-glucosyltransferase/alpha-amylase